MSQQDGSALGSPRDVCVPPPGARNLPLLNQLQDGCLGRSKNRPSAGADRTAAAGRRPPPPGPASSPAPLGTVSNPSSSAPPTPRDVFVELEEGPESPYLQPRSPSRLDQTCTSAPKEAKYEGAAPVRAPRDFGYEAAFTKQLAEMQAMQDELCKVVKEYSETRSNATAELSKKDLTDSLESFARGFADTLERLEGRVQDLSLDIADMSARVLPKTEEAEAGDATRAEPVQGNVQRTEARQDTEFRWEHFEAARSRISSGQYLLQNIEESAFASEEKSIKAIPVKDSAKALQERTPGIHKALAALRRQARDRLRKFEGELRSVDLFRAVVLDAPDVRFGHVRGAPWWSSWTPLFNLMTRSAEHVSGTVDSAFACFSIVLGVLFFAFVGVSCDYGVDGLLTGKEVPVWVTNFERVFAGLFALEMLLRIVYERSSFFVNPGHGMWNCIDLLLVILLILAFFLPYISSGLAVSAAFDAMVLFRGLRLLRAGQRMRHVRYLRTLRVMLASIQASLSVFLWMLAFISLFTFVFAVFFLQVIVAKLSHNKIADLEVAWLRHVKEQYGSVAAAIGTLLSGAVGALSGSTAWEMAAKPVRGLGEFYYGVLVCFVAFLVFGLLNVLASLLVERATEIARVDRDLSVREELSHRGSVANQLRQFLRQASSDEAIISKDTLREMLGWPEAKAILRTLGVDGADVWGVFKLLDIGHSNAVSCDDFVLSLLRCRGSARSADLLSLVVDCKRNEARWNSFMQYVEEEFSALFDVMNPDAAKQHRAAPAKVAEDTVSPMVYDDTRHEI